MLRSLSTVFITLLLSISLLVANVWWRQKVQFEEGEGGLRSGDFMVALTGYESAIRMYLPFSATVELAAKRIWALAEQAEREGDPERALLAYRSLRSAFYAVRWLQQPGKDWIARCDTRIALLAPSRKGQRP